MSRTRLLGTRADCRTAGQAARPPATGWDTMPAEVTVHFLAQACSFQAYLAGYAR